MPISPAGKVSNRRDSVGMTLVELLVVVTIISILALGVGLVAGGAFSPSGGSPRAVAERWIDATTRARDTAILGRATVGLYPRSDGWIAAARDAEGAWSASTAQQATAQPMTWTIEGRSFLPRLSSPTAGSVPELLFLPDGRSTAFAVIIGSGGAQVRCRNDGWGAVACE